MSEICRNLPAVQLPTCLPDTIDSEWPLKKKRLKSKAKKKQICYLIK